MKLATKRFLCKVARPSLRSLVIAFCSGDPEVISRVSIEDVVTRVETFMEGMAMVHFMAFHFMIFIFEYATVPLTRKILPLRFLPMEKRIRYLDRWADSRFSPKRIAYIGLKYIVMSQIYSEHALLESIGYGPDLRSRLGQQA